MANWANGCVTITDAIRTDFKELTYLEWGIVLKIYSTYKARISTAYWPGGSEYRHIFADTVCIYRQVVDFFIQVCLQCWPEISSYSQSKERMMHVEHITHKAKGRPDVPYDFDTRFYKFPSYLRRAAIAQAIGKVSSYISNLKNWEEADPSSRGSRPSLPSAGFVYPVLYKGASFQKESAYTAQIKVFRNNTWDWISVQLRKSDMDYIRHHCSFRKECAPTLQKRHKRWYLVFPFEERVTLNDTHVSDQIAVSVDLGINSPAVCSVMRADGTVVGRHFLHLPAEYDSLQRKLDKIVRAQKHGARKLQRFWDIANGVNHRITVKTAQFITEIAVKYNADVIVLEHLDVGGKKRGSKKQRLHLWKARAVQRIVTDKAHRLGIRISRVNAWNTSRFAFDGSGRVKRGKESPRTDKKYSLCEFQNGKLYNCDLNASYNIGARYFIREITKSLPATARQHMEAKVPACAKRSSCTLSTLISLNAELYAEAYSIGVRTVSVGQRVRTSEKRVRKHATLAV